MTDALALKLMSEDDWPRVEAAFAHTFADCRAPSVWHWRYRRHLRTGEGWRGILCVAPDDAVAAYIGVTVHRGWAGGTDVSLLAGRDNFSAPGWRGGARKSPFVLAERMFHDRHSPSAAMVFGFALDRRVRLSAALGMTAPLQNGAWLEAFVSTRDADPGCSVMLGPTVFDEPEWDLFWQRRRTGLRLSVVHDRDYLAWRFDRRYGRDYRRWAIRSLLEDAPLGYFVTANVGVGTVVLVGVALPTPPQQARDAMIQLEAVLRREGASRVLTYCGPGCPELRQLQSLGFRCVAPPLPVLPMFRGYDALPPGIDVQQDFALSLADSDLY